MKVYLSEDYPKHIITQQPFEWKGCYGNTTLYHHSKSLKYIEDVMWHPRVDKMTFNKQNYDTYDIVLISKELLNEKVTQFKIYLFFYLFYEIFFFFFWGRFLNMKAVFIYFSISNVNYDYEDIWFLFPFRMFLSYIYIYI